MPSALPQTLADFLDVLPVGVFAIDGEGIIVYVNPEQCENSRLTPADLVGQNYRAFFYDTLQSQRLLDLFDRLHQEGVAFAVTIPHYRRHADGTLLALTVKGYRYRGYMFLLTSIDTALQVEQARFARLFEHANDGIFIMDRQTRFVAVNQKFAEMTGLPKEEIIGKTVELFLPGRLPESLARLEEVLRTGRLGPYELEVSTPLGNKIFSLNAVAWYEGDVPVGIMNIARDVTEEHRQQQERETLYQLAHDLACSPDISAVADGLFARAQSVLHADSGFLLVINAEGTELKGVAAYGIDPQTFQQEKIELQKEAAPAALAFQQKRPIVVTDVAHSPLVSERIRRTYNFVKSVWVTPLMHGERAVGVFAVGYPTVREATTEEVRLLQLLGDEAALAIERARLTEELQEREERYRNLFENANDGILSFTLEGIITNLNRGLEVMTQWPREAVIGKTYTRFLTPASAALLEERTRKAVRGEKLPSVFEADIVRKDGSLVPVECRARFIRDKRGNPIGIQGICRDITAKKALEQQRAEFLAMLAHDLKNPLAAILGYADLLAEESTGRRSATEDDCLQRLKDNALTIHSLIANYLDLAKVEAGSLILHTSPLALPDLLRRVITQYSAMALRRRLSLTLDLPKAELPTIVGDAVALERVFSNLIHNALKFTPETGSIRVSARRLERGVLVEVWDTGPGIAPEVLPTLFERYRRAAGTRHYEGTGLGLFIVKTLVEAHGGRVEVESSLGAGACFRVFLPEAAST